MTKFMTQVHACPLQYLEEFMSTRLGVRRTGEIVSARSRTGADGRLYYDVEVGRGCWKQGAPLLPGAADNLLQCCFGAEG